MLKLPANMLYSQRSLWATQAPNVTDQAGPIFQTFAARMSLLCLLQEILLGDVKLLQQNTGGTVHLTGGACTSSSWAPLMGLSWKIINGEKLYGFSQVDMTR